MTTVTQTADLLEQLHQTYCDAASNGVEPSLALADLLVDHAGELPAVAELCRDRFHRESSVYYAAYESVIVDNDPNCNYGCLYNYLVE